MPKRAHATHVIYSFGSWIPKGASGLGRCPSKIVSYKSYTYTHLYRNLHKNVNTHTNVALIQTQNVTLVGATELVLTFFLCGL